MTYMSLCVVMTDWGNLRDEIFSRTGFAPSVEPAWVRGRGGRKPSEGPTKRKYAHAHTHLTHHKFWGLYFQREENARIFSLISTFIISPAQLYK